VPKMGKLITLISAMSIFLFDVTQALSCADGLACAVVRSTPDGFVALRARPSVSSKLIHKLKPYQIVVISVSDCAPNRDIDPWTQVECVPDAVLDTTLGRIRCPGFSRVLPKNRCERAASGISPGTKKFFCKNVFHTKATSFIGQNHFWTGFCQRGHD